MGILRFGAAAVAAGKLGVRPAIDRLLQRVKDTHPQVRRASLDALRQLKEPRVVPLAVVALKDFHTEGQALQCLAQLGTAEQAAAVTELAKRNSAAAILGEAVRP